LGKKKELSALLVTEQARGKTLDHYIAAAVHEQQQSRLIEKLGLLARFFSLLHARTLSRTSTSFDYPAGYLAHMLALFRERTVFGAEAGAIQEEADKWWAKPELMSDCEVLVHRDATPTNFLFSGRQVTGIDLDKMRMADRCWDLGFIAAELKHHFLWRTGDPWGAEPYIGHFLREYAAGLPYGGRFADITRRTPLFMGLGLARIARNEWLGEAYRRRLLVEAGLCLK
ncbi:MAG: phosphotransferase, partial [Dehalococcoidia bacterium]|nr:phosphotransferase [Dehalococcoidia bacterium]